MKRVYHLPFFTLIFLSNLLVAQADFNVVEYTNVKKYEKANEDVHKLKNRENRVVFMGNSITEAWPNHDPSFFMSGQNICRGISGQVTSQMLLRFRADVIDLNPMAVVILAGTNDLAQNSGFISEEMIFSNIMSMIDLAHANKINVILCSVLPTIDFPWRKGLAPATKIKKLNKMLQSFASENDIPWVDYHSALADYEGGLKVPEFTSEDDLVHPNSNGYRLMRSLLEPIIQEVLTK